MKALYTYNNGGDSFDYLLDVGKRSKAYLSVKDGVLTVRLPFGGTRKAAEDFIGRNIGWVKKSLENAEERSHLPKGFTDGEDFSLLGKRRRLRIEESPEYREPVLTEDELTVFVPNGGSRSDAVRQFSRYVCELCESRVKQAFDEYIPRLGLHPKKITIKRMTSRWGSCSSGGNISINLDLICFAQECIDYVVVHELCHLKHMNHGADFWRLVATCCPDYKRLREIMKH